MHILYVRDNQEFCFSPFLTSLSLLILINCLHDCIRSLFPPLYLCPCLFLLHLLSSTPASFSQCAGHTQGGGGRTRPLPPCCSHVLPVSRTWSSEKKAWQTASATSHWSGLWRGMHMHKHHRYSIVAESELILLSQTCDLWCVVISSYDNVSSSAHYQK